MFSSWSGCLCIMILISSAMAQLQIDNFASLTLELKTRFQAQCIFLVTSEDLNYQRDAVEVSKTLSKNAIKMSILSGRILNKTANEFRCRGNRPIYILLADDMVRRHLLLIHKIPSYPRWVVAFDRSRPYEDFFADIFVPFDCEMLVAEMLGFELRLTYVYRVTEVSPLSKQQFGTWSSRRGLEASRNYLYATRNDLGGLVMKTTTVQYVPITKLVHDATQQGLYIDGMYGEVWQILEKEQNFSSNFIPPSDGEYGVCKNGNCTGMLAMVVNGDVHIAVDEFAYDGKRMDVVDFLVPVSSFRMTLYVYRPETIRFQWTSFLLPFSPMLWLGIVGSILVSSVLLSIGQRIESNEWKLLDSAFPVFALFCGQGDITASTETSFTRRVLLSVGIASTVVAAAYSGALTSTFAVQVPELPYDTVEEYVADPAFELGISPNAYWIYFENARSGVAKDLREQLYTKRNEQPRSRVGGFKKLCERAGKFGWISSAVYDPEYFAKFDCVIVPVPGYIMVDTVSFILQKGSPYKDLFNYKLSLIRTTGILNLLHHRKWPETLSKLETMKPLVNFYQVVPILAVLALGIAVSAMLAVVEMTHRRSA